MEEEDLSDLIARKEKELQDISKLRLIQLEDQIRSKNQQIDSMTEKLRAFQEDFNYNVKLIEDRDSELLDLETKFDSIKKLQKQKDCEISELRGLLASSEQRLKQEIGKIRTQERVLTDSRDHLREELTEFKWRKEEEVRKLNKTIEELEKQQYRVVRAKEQEVNEVKQGLVGRYEKEIQAIHSKFNDEKEGLLNEIEDKDEKLRLLAADRKELQEKLQKFIQDNVIERLELEHFDEIREKNLIIGEKDLQINKLIDHSNHLLQQMETLKAQQASETEFWTNQKEFYEKELQKIKNASKDEQNFLKESFEIQTQRLNSTFSSQISRLQQRLAQVEGESENYYIQSQQLREKILNAEKKTANEVNRVEDNYKHDLIVAEETSRSLKQEVNSKDQELKKLQENLGSWKSRTEQYLEENKGLRNALEECQAELNNLRSEVSSIKASHAPVQDNLISSLRNEYEKKFKELTDFYEKNQPKASKSRYIPQNEALPKIWSEDYGPASSIKSSSNDLAAENEDLKRIIEEMRNEIESINLNALQSPLESQHLKETISKLRNEVIRITAERDQLLEISSELKAELRMLGVKSVQFNDPGLVEKLEEVQEEFKGNLPKYEEFEEIAHQRPERDDRPGKVKSNTNRETASQKEVHERIRANLKKTKKPLARNYNIKD